MEKSRTIAEIKTSFIRNQIRTLSASIAPQDGWRDFAPDSEGDLSDRVVDEAMQKRSSISSLAEFLLGRINISAADSCLQVNATLKQHNRVVYSNQAIQHVARQIESLYWESVKTEVLKPNAHSTGVEVGSDLSNHLYERPPCRDSGWN